jgi:hypothetical protein
MRKKTNEDGVGQSPVLPSATSSGSQGQAEERPLHISQLGSKPEPVRWNLFLQNKNHPAVPRLTAGLVDGSGGIRPVHETNSGCPPLLTSPPALPVSLFLSTHPHSFPHLPPHHKTPHSAAAGKQRLIHSPASRSVCCVIHSPRTTARPPWASQWQLDKRRMPTAIQDDLHVCAFGPLAWTHPPLRHSQRPIPARTRTRTGGRTQHRIMLR